MRNYFLFILFMLLPCPVQAQGSLPGPVAVKVLGIGNENTLLVERPEKPGVKINVEIRGYQVAHHNAACELERGLSEETTKTISELVDGQNVQLINVSYGSDEYSAQAEIINHAGINIGDYLFEEKGLAQPINAARLIEWCADKY